MNGLCKKIFLVLAGMVCAGQADELTTLWYQQPAQKFYQSLPLGNGRIGAMVFGGVDEERIILNESSLWSGSRGEANRADAHKVSWVAD